MSSIIIIWIICCMIVFYIRSHRIKEVKNLEVPKNTLSGMEILDKIISESEYHKKYGHFPEDAPIEKIPVEPIPPPIRIMREGELCIRGGKGNYKLMTIGCTPIPCKYSRE